MSTQLQTAAVMTSMPPQLDQDAWAADETVDLSNLMQTTPAPYVDYRDELLFDPDEIEAVGAAGSGYRAAGDAMLDVPIPSNDVNVSNASGGGGGGGGQDTSSSSGSDTNRKHVVINVLDKPEPEMSSDDGKGLFGMNMWQTTVVLIAVVVILILCLYALYKFRGNGAADQFGGGPMDVGGSAPQFGGYGGTGF